MPYLAHFSNNINYFNICLHCIFREEMWKLKNIIFTRKHNLTTLFAVVHTSCIRNSVIFTETIQCQESLASSKSLTLFNYCARLTVSSIHPWSASKFMCISNICLYQLDDPYLAISTLQLWTKATTSTSVSINK